MATALSSRIIRFLNQTSNQHQFLLLEDYSLSSPPQFHKWLDLNLINSLIAGDFGGFRIRSGCCLSWTTKARPLGSTCWSLLYLLSSESLPKRAAYWLLRAQKTKFGRLETVAFRDACLCSIIHSCCETYFPVFPAKGGLDRGPILRLLRS